MINGITAGQSSLYNNRYDPSLYGARSARTAPNSATSVPAPTTRQQPPVQPAASAPAARSAPLNKPDMLSRLENDPVAMAVRGRIQYAGDSAAQAAPSVTAAAAKAGEAGHPAAMTGIPGVSGKAGEAGQAAGQAGGLSGEETQSAQEVMAEAECQTCAERRYQDGSDDPGVSFKTAAHIDPDQAASVVRAHEQEHVARNQAEAQREDRKVVSQSVTLHTAICPECGRSYVSGGTTRTVTKADLDAPTEKQQNQQRAQNPFAA